MAEGQSFYEEHEAEEILRLASHKSGLEGGMTRERLLATAEELGISAEAVDAAELEVRATREDAVLRGQYAVEMRRNLWSGVSSWLSGSVVLLGINLVTEGFRLSKFFDFWCWWPIGIWGFVVAGGFVSNVFKPRSTVEAGYQQWRARRERRELRRKRKDQRGFDARIEELVDDPLEDALDDGHRRDR